MFFFFPLCRSNWQKDNWGSWVCHSPLHLPWFFFLFAGLFLLHMCLRVWRNVLFVLTFVHAEYLIPSCFWDRGWMNKCYKADITGDSVFQASSFIFKSARQLMRKVFALQQIHNPSVLQQFPNFPVRAKNKLENRSTLCIFHLHQLKTHIWACITSHMFTSTQ